MSELAVVFADFSEILLDAGAFLTELTWVVEDTSYQSLVPHHYFINYPGAKASERAIANVIGGAPLMRYSAPSVLRTFFDGLPQKSIVALPTQAKKEKFKVYLKSEDVSDMLGASAQKSLCIYDDVVLDESEKAFVQDVIADTRQEAARKFGNSI